MLFAQNQTFCPPPSSCRPPLNFWAGYATASQAPSFRFRISLIAKFKGMQLRFTKIRMRALSPLPDRVQAIWIVYNNCQILSLLTAADNIQLATFHCQINVLHCKRISLLCGIWQRVIACTGKTTQHEGQCSYISKWWNSQYRLNSQILTPYERITLLFRDQS